MQIDALILVGGLGTRLRPVVADRPKILAPVAGEPFVVHLIRQVERAGVRRAILATGYRADMVQDVIGGHVGGVEIFYSREDEPLGTGGAIRLALPHVNSDPVLILNGDSYCDADLASMISSHRAPATILATRVEDVSRFGKLAIDANQNVQRFEEKGGSGAGYINAGVYVLSRALIESILPVKPVSIERDVFPKWIGRGLRAFPTAGKFIDIGTPESYRTADAFFGKNV